MRLKGKRIDKWEFRIDTIPVTVHVSMRRESGRTDFFVFDDAYDLNMADEDINKLKKATEEHLHTHLKITWEKYFHMKFHGRLPFQQGEEEDNEEAMVEAKADLSFEFEAVEIGTKPDGSKCHRSCPRRNHFHRETIYAGMPDTSDELDDVRAWDRVKTQKSLVLATPANEATLRAFADAFQAMAKRIYDWMAPAVIAKNLEQGMRLLRIEGSTESASQDPRSRPDRQSRSKPRK